MSSSLSLFGFNSHRCHLSSRAGDLTNCIPAFTHSIMILMSYGCDNLLWSMTGLSFALEDRSVTEPVDWGLSAATPMPNVLERALWGSFRRLGAHYDRVSGQ